MKLIFFGGVLALLLPLAAAAHGGGLDSNGGHTNRKTGEYHCHREPCFSNQNGETPNKPTKSRGDSGTKKKPAREDDGADITL